MENEVFLGIDTSCYTTSLCLLKSTGELLADARQILKVPEGNCGLQQSVMVYQHTRNLPELMAAVFTQKNFKICGIGVSAQPRPREDSYMPAFLAGLGLARSLQAVLKVPLWEISHQENHLEAGIWSAGGPESNAFLMLHASGGTTDLLLASKNAEGRYDLENVGGSIDLHAGQFIDRVGVALKLQFPCGNALEELAKTSTAPYKVPVSVQDTKISLAGPATAALRALQKGVPAADLAAGVQLAIGTAFAKMLANAAKKFSVKDVLMVGGVGANTVIREVIKSKLAVGKTRLWVPEPRYSSDNASGCAAFALRKGLQR